jgi:hypothetical protein
VNTLEPDLLVALKSVVQTVKDLRGEDAQLRIENASVHREVGIEREITRSMVAAVDLRLDETNRQLARLASALEKLANA